MIVIRTNLYAERLETARRAKPLRLGRAVVALLLLGVTLFWWTQQREVADLRLASTQTAKGEAALEGELIATRARVASLVQDHTQRDTILAFAKQRINWAEILEQLFASIPSSVELTSLQVTTDAPPRSIRVTGRSIGAQPRLGADKCMLQMVEVLNAAGHRMQGSFVLLEDAAVPVNIGGIAYPAANFTIELNEEVARAN